MTRRRLLLATLLAAGLGLAGPADARAQEPVQMRTDTRPGICLWLEIPSNRWLCLQKPPVLPQVP